MVSVADVPLAVPLVGAARSAPLFAAGIGAGSGGRNRSAGTSTLRWVLLDGSGTSFSADPAMHDHTTMLPVPATNLTGGRFCRSGN